MKYEYLFVLFAVFLIAVPIVNAYFIEADVNPILNITINGTELTDELVSFDITKDATLMSNHDYCFDNDTQLKNLTYENCAIIGGSQECYTSNKIQYISCETGCDSNTGKCRPDALIGLVIIIILVIGFIYLLYRIWSR